METVFKLANQIKFFSYESSLVLITPKPKKKHSRSKLFLSDPHPYIPPFLYRFVRGNVKAIPKRFISCSVPEHFVAAAIIEHDKQMFSSVAFAPMETASGAGYECRTV